MLPIHHRLSQRGRHSVPRRPGLAFIGCFAIGCFVIACSWGSLAEAQPPRQPSAVGAAAQANAKPNARADAKPNPKADASPAARPVKASSSPAQLDLNNLSPNQPQAVYVAVSRAEILSGPSSEYYPTGHVARGMALEAYHRTADGWLGIRPPEGSFSWVPASDAYLLPGGRVIEITSQHAVSWIGSSLGSAKQYRWQVELRPGEQLVVLGEMTNQSEDGREALWYKIAPPAGEFRWIREQAISLTAVAPAASQIAAPKSPVEVAEHRSQSQNEAVRSASFDEDIFADGAVVYNSGGAGSAGEIIYEDGQYPDGYYSHGYHDDTHTDGSYVGEGYVDEGYGYEPGIAYGGSGIPRSGSAWDGWHAMELTDDGFRVPFLERRYQQAQAQRMVDPRNHDPFSLSMPGKIVEPQSMRQQVRQDVGVAPERRFTPWRDPRDLRSQRMQGSRGNSFSSTRSADNSAEDLVSRETTTATTATASDLTAAEDLLGRLVSAVKKAAPAASDLAAMENAATRRPSQEPTAATPTGFASDTTWFGVNGQLTQTAAPGLNAPGLNALELRQLQLVMSEMVAQPMNLWNMSPLMERAKHFIEHGASAVERGQARLMLERMEAFDLLAKKSGFGSLGPVLTASATLPVSQSANSQQIFGGGIVTAGYESAINPNAANQQGYDATGWLVPVHAAKTGQPTHAITNDAGHVIAYVTGLPGMNLDVYLNQPIGIAGLRGFLPQLQAQHIQAQRVVRLR